MAELLAPMSQVAADNPYSQFQRSYSTEQLSSGDNGNYPICTPFQKQMVAQDAVNQAAAVIVMSAGKARELAIPEKSWILQLGYAEGMDQFLSQRADIGTSQAMEKVFQAAFERADIQQEEIDLIDIYSCFPCAVESARDALGIAADDPRPLTVTGGLPFFGGPGNEYSMHALAEMVLQLRGRRKPGLITANGGFLSKHAALVLAANDAGYNDLTLDYSGLERAVIGMDDISPIAACDTPTEGTVLSYTVIFERKRDDFVVVLGETEGGERFLAKSADAETVARAKGQPPIGASMSVEQKDGKNYFSFA